MKTTTIIFLFFSISVFSQNGLRFSKNTNGYTNVDKLWIGEYPEFPAWKIRVSKAPSELYNIVIDYELDKKLQNICFVRQESTLQINLKNGKSYTFKLRSKSSCNNEGILVFPLIKREEENYQNESNYRQYGRTTSFKIFKLIGEGEWSEINIITKNHEFSIKPTDADIDNADKYFIHALRALTTIDNTKGLNYVFKNDKKEPEISCRKYSLLGKGIGIYIIAGNEFDNLTDIEINQHFEKAMIGSGIKAKVFIERTDEYDFSLYHVYALGTSVGSLELTNKFQENWQKAIQIFKSNLHIN